MLAHGHAAFAPGGAEIAARALHLALRDAGTEPLLVSCLPPGVRARPEPGEAFVETARLDSLTLLRRDPLEHEPLLKLLRQFRPDVVHLHHVLGFGADVLPAIRRALPGAALVLTLHEYVPICHRQGQMVTTAGELCERSSPEACAACFPEVSPQRFLARELALRALLACADACISPSDFLAARYAEWGLPAEKLHRIENVLARRPPIAEEPRPGTRDRFAFFGQINPFKGLDLLLEAVNLIPADRWGKARLSIHGSGLDKQPEPFRARIAALLDGAGDRVVFSGPYDNAEVGALMASADWIVVPSIWWENSPVVIQEGLAAGRPVIAPDLGGLAEKVRGNAAGLLFAPRDPQALAERLVEAQDAPLWARLAAGLRRPPAPETIAVAHLTLYRSLLEARKAPGTAAA
jgi:glycosyltransferase involved in cell wall biosynthesis